REPSGQGREHLRRMARLCPSQRPDDLPRHRHLQDGQRPHGGGRRPAPGPWNRGSPGDRRLGHAHRALGQYKRPHEHGWREGGGHDQGGRKGGAQGRRIEWANRGIAVKLLTSLLALLGLSVAVAACNATTDITNPLGYQPQSKENLLADSGFKKLTL